NSGASIHNPASAQPRSSAACHSKCSVSDQSAVPIHTLYHVVPSVAFQIKVDWLVMVIPMTCPGASNWMLSGSGPIQNSGSPLVYPAGPQDCTHTSYWPLLG